MRQRDFVQVQPNRVERFVIDGACIERAQVPVDLPSGIGARAEFEQGGAILVPESLVVGDEVANFAGVAPLLFAVDGAVVGCVGGCRCAANDGEVVAFKSA